MSRVKEIHGDEEFVAVFQEASKAQLVAIDFSASWCGPCHAIAPVFATLSTKFPQAEFLKVDVDDCPTVAATMGVRAMPTFQFFKKGQKVQEFSGADANKLEHTIAHLLQQGDASSSAASGPGSLAEYIGKGLVECLNEAEGHGVAHVLVDDASVLLSDCDEQLIMNIGFNQAVKISAIRFFAPSDGSGPKSVKIFINRASTPDFDDAEKMQEVELVSLKPEDLNGNTMKLNYVKFQNVSNIVLFVQSNQGGKDVTALRYVELLGEPRDNTNMKEFKRVAGKAGESDH